MKEREEMLERLGLREATLVHYDIRDGDARAKTALKRFLSGRVEYRGGRRYLYPGLVTEGALRVGQSVYLLEPDLGSRLIGELQKLRVRYSARTVYVG